MITGAGCVTSLGNTVDRFIYELDEFFRKPEKESHQYSNAFSVKKVKDFKFYDDEMMAKFLRLDRSCQYILEATRQALENAGLSDERIISGKRMSVIIASTYGVLDSIEKFLCVLYKTGSASSILFKQTANNLLSGIISYKHKISGYNTTIYNGWTSGLDALLLANELIINEMADIVLVGGVDILNEAIIDYVKNTYIHDRSLNQLIISEGAGAIVLESKEISLQRNVKIKGELVKSGQKLFYKNADYGNYIYDILKENKYFDKYFANINGTILDEYEMNVIHNMGITEKSLVLKGIIGECGAASGILQIIYALHMAAQKSIIINAENSGRLSYALINSS